MKKWLPIWYTGIVLITIGFSNQTKAQCTSCTTTVNTDNATVNTTGGADVICITESVVNTTINNLGTNDIICIAPGVTWDLPTNLNYNAPITFNISAGATVNAATSGSNGNIIINNSGILNFTNPNVVNFTQNGGTSTYINNLAGGVMNHLTGTNFNMGNGSHFYNEGTVNFNNLEFSETDNPTNTATGVINVKRTLYIHSFGFNNEGKINTTCTATGVSGADTYLNGVAAGGCGMVIGDKGIFFAEFASGSCTVIEGLVKLNGPANISGYVENSSGDFTINKLISGTGGAIVVKSGVSSTQGDGGIMNPTLLFYDVDNDPSGVGPNGQPATHGLDINAGNPADAFTVSSTLPTNPCERASIGGRVFEDNGSGVFLNNGIQDSGEAGKQYLIVELLDGNGNAIDSDPSLAGIQPTTQPTDVSGRYLFGDLPAGSYQIRFSNIPDGYALSPSDAGTDDELDSDGGPLDDGTSTTAIYTLAAGQVNLTVDLGIVSEGALPVNLISFVSEIVKDGVELRWKTTDEKAFSHYELLKSGNALEFTTLSTLEGASLGTYSFTDDNPIEGINYYRLKMVNQDRSAEMSKIIAVDYSEDAIYAMVQNPSHNGSFTVYTNLATPKFTLLNIAGKQVSFTESRTNTNQYQLTVKNYTEGIYILRFESGAMMINKKLLIK